MLSRPVSASSRPGAGGRRTLVYEGAIAAAASGGAGRHLVEVANALDEMDGVSLSVVVPYFVTDGTQIGPLNPSITAYHLPCRGRTPLGYLWYEVKKAALLGRLRWIARRQPAPVLLTRISPFGIAAPLAKLMGWRVVLEVNGLPGSEAAQRGTGALGVRVIDAVVRLQLWSGRTAICVTKGIERAIASMAPLATVVIENGASERYAPIELAAREGEPRRIAYLGVTAPWMELDVALEALAILDRNDPGEWRLDVIGDGQLTELLKDKAARLGVGHLVRWHGWVSDGNEITAAVVEAKIGLAPIRPKDDNGTCGSPLKVFDYLMMGRVVVGSDIDGITELDYPRLVRYRQGDAADMARALREASAVAPLEPDELISQRTRVDWRDRARRVLSVVETV